jgi:hypothetical protein
VIVDARLLGGDVRTGCATGDPDSGLEALTMAGFRYAFVPRQPGLVCQVDGVPACDRTSTTTYWSYWYRAKGSSTWVYSSRGAGAHDPAPGGTEAWVWQEGGRREPPSIGLRTICPQLAAPAPGTSTTTAKPVRTRDAPTRTADADRATARPATKTATERRTARAARSSATSAPPPTTPSSTTPATTPPVTTSSAAEPSTTAVARRSDGAVGSDGDPGAPPWTGLAVGGALVAALGAAAVLRGRRTGGAG